MSKYDRARLADNADTIEPGIQVLTPAMVEAESVAWFLTEQRKGMVENVKAFKAGIRAVRPSDNVNRIDLLTSPNLINQLIVMSHTIQFEL
jgi:phage tail sheath gpL-like